MARAKKITEEKVEEMVVEKTPKKRGRVQIPKDVECVVMSLYSGELVYRDKRTTRLFEFPELADTEIMTIEELVTMKNLNRKFFKNKYITVVDVFSDEYTLDDVYAFLQITGDTEILSAEDMDDIILNMGINEFRVIMQNRKEGALRQRIVERALMLYKDGEFNDYSKIKIMRDVTKKNYLFE